MRSGKNIKSLAGGNHSKTRKSVKKADGRPNVLSLGSTFSDDLTKTTKKLLSPPSLLINSLLSLSSWQISNAEF